MMLTATAEHASSDDEALALRARRGERGAFVVLVARYEERIHRLAMRMSRNASDAEDVLQETFLHAYRGIGAFHGESRFATWLYRIAMNEALMQRRAAKRRRLEPIEALSPRFADVGSDAVAPAHRADDLVESKTIVRRVREALEQLDEPQRAALVLRDLEEMTAEEAGQILGVSPDAVRQRAHRARLRLRELLGDLLAGH